MNDMIEDNILDNLRDIEKNGTLLDILLEFEEILDNHGMYVYKNWNLGEVVSGPKLSRHWLNVVLMYPYKKMPDPKAVSRLTDIGCEVTYKKSKFGTPVTPKSQADIDDDGKPKTKSHTVWLVDIFVPRKLVDSYTDETINVGDEQINTDDLSQAYDAGLDDESSVEQQQDT